MTDQAFAGSTGLVKAGNGVFTLPSANNYTSGTQVHVHRSLAGLTRHTPAATIRATRASARIKTFLR